MLFNTIRAKKFKSNIRKFNLLVIILISLIALLIAASHAKNAKKKLYISSIETKGVSSGLGDKVREGLKLTIFEKFGNKYHVLDDEAIKVMYKQAEKILASGCTDQSCMTQIADGINADEIIYGKIKKDEKQLKLILTNLERNRRTLSIRTKSIVNISFPENRIEHFISESAKKLINRHHKISKKIKPSFDKKVSFKELKIEKVKGLEISEIKFFSVDDTISNILAYSKEIVNKGDKAFKSKDFETAKNEYVSVLNKIKTKLTTGKQKKLKPFVKEVSIRADAAYAMIYNNEIEEIDSNINTNKFADINFLENTLIKYQSIDSKVIKIPKEIRGQGIKSINKIINNRTSAVYIALIATNEKKGDAAFKEYRFEKALQLYSSGKNYAAGLKNKKMRIANTKRYSKKITATKRTGENYLSNNVKSLIDRAEFYNFQDKSDKALDMMVNARQLILHSPFKTKKIIGNFNKIAAVIKVNKITQNSLKIRKKIIGGIQFIYIPGGIFIMGNPENIHDSENPQHKVSLNSFWISQFEITQKQYSKYMGTNPSRIKGENHPVEYVSWHDAIKFCNQFNNRWNVNAWLPYEAEWEYAARSGTITKYYWGNSVNGNYCWYQKNSVYKTHPVGTKKPNFWGLYDMSGNVSEWCMDWYNKYYYKSSPLKNPTGPKDGINRIFRGGSWSNISEGLFLHNRNADYPKTKRSDLGFRIVIVPKRK